MMKNLSHSTPGKSRRNDEVIQPLIHLAKLFTIFFFFSYTRQVFAARSRPVHIRSLVSLLLQFATSQKRRRTVPPFQNAASKQRGRSNRSDN